MPLTCADSAATLERGFKERAKALNQNATGLESPTELRGHELATGEEGSEGVIGEGRYSTEVQQAELKGSAPRRPLRGRLAAGCDEGT